MLHRPVFVEGSLDAASALQWINKEEAKVHDHERQEDDPDSLGSHDKPAQSEFPPLPREAILTSWSDSCRFP